MVTCPQCHGAKTVSGTRFLDGVDAKGRKWGRIEQYTEDCRNCAGAGEIPEEHAARIIEGERMRKDRIRRMVSQREEAERLGITQQQLNAIEHGREA